MTALYRLLLLRPIDAAPAALLHPELRASHTIALRIGGLLFVLAALNAVDLAYTLFAHRIGWLNEMNPVAEVFLSQDLLHSLISYKLLMMLAGTTMLWRLRKCPWTPAACWILITAHVILGILWYCWSREVTWAYEMRLANGM